MQLHSTHYLEGWLKQITLAQPTLKDLYNHIYVSATQATNEVILSDGKSIIEHLNNLGIKCVSLDGKLGDNHRDALYKSIMGIDKSSDFRVHYCDFDRILLWAIEYPIELSNVLKSAEAVNVLFPCRGGIWHQSNSYHDAVQKAWSSHPITQKSTEIVITHGINEALLTLTESNIGTTCRPDPLGTSQITCPYFTKTLIKKSLYTGFPQAEWLAIIIGQLHADHYNHSFESIDVAGLKFETLEILKYSEPTCFNFNEVYKKRFEKIENSNTEAQSRVNIAISMLESFLMGLTIFELSEKVKVSIHSYISDLKQLSTEIENDTSQTKYILERHYKQFISEHFNKI